MPLPTAPLAICGTLQRALEAVAPQELEERRLVLSRLSLIMSIVAQDDVVEMSAWWDSSSRATRRSLLQARSFDGSTVMHQAVDSNSVHTIKFLMTHGADLSLRRNDGRTPLGLLRSVEVAKALCKALMAARVFKCSPSSFTMLDDALGCAIADGKPAAIVCVLLSAGAQPTASMLMSAISASNAELTSALLTCRGWTCVRTHAMAGGGDRRLACLEALLSHDAYHPVHDREALWAEVVRLLADCPELSTCLVVPAEFDVPAPAMDAYLEPRDGDLEWYREEERRSWSHADYFLSVRLGADELLPVHAAAALGEGGRDTLQALLPHTDVELAEVPNDDGRTAYHCAAETGSLGALRLLLERAEGEGYEPPLDIRDENGQTALMLAAGGGAADVVQELLARSADANVTDDDGSTALHLAAAELWTGCMAALADAGVHVNLENADGFTPLLLATGARDLETFDEETGETKLTIPPRDTAETEAARLAAVQVLLRAGAKPVHMKSVHMVYPLVAAVSHASMSVVKALLQARAEPYRRVIGYGEWRERREAGTIGDAVVAQPLELSIRFLHECEDLVLMLASAMLERGVERRAAHLDLGIGGFSVMDGVRLAIQRSHAELAIKLIDLMVASGHEESLVTFTGYGDEHKAPALHFAAASGAVSVVRCLLGHGQLPGSHIEVDGFDSNLDTDFGSAKPRLTPLLHATLRGQVRTARLLLDAKANVDQRTRVKRDEYNHDQEVFDGFTSLHAACALGSLELVELLLERGADANIRGIYHTIRSDVDDRRAADSDRADVTPLHLAIDEGHVQVACRLLEKGLTASSLHEGGRRWPAHLFKRISSSGDHLDYWERRDYEDRQSEGRRKEEHTIPTFLLAAQSRHSFRLLVYMAAAARSCGAVTLQALLARPVPERKFTESPARRRKSVLSSFHEPAAPPTEAELELKREVQAASALRLALYYSVRGSASDSVVRWLLPLARAAAKVSGRLEPVSLAEHSYFFWRYDRDDISLLPFLGWNVHSLLAYRCNADADGDSLLLLLSAICSHHTERDIRPLLNDGLLPRNWLAWAALLVSPVLRGAAQEMTTRASTSPVVHRLRHVTRSLVSLLHAEDEQCTEGADKEGAAEAVDRPSRRDRLALSTKVPPAFFSPLHAAALLGDVELATELLSMRTSSRAWMGKAPDGDRWAAELLRLFMRPDADGYTPLHYAALGQFRFDSYCAGTTDPSRTHEPTSAGFAAAHFTWLGSPKDVDTSSCAHKRRRVEAPAPVLPEQTDLGRASAQIITALVDAGADPNEPVGGAGKLQGCTALELAVRTRRRAVTAVLLAPCVGGASAVHRPTQGALDRALSTTRMQIETGEADAPELSPQRAHHSLSPAPRLLLAKAEQDNAKHVGEALLIAGAVEQDR